jgi:large subunit ribosomal protein L4
MELDIYKTDGSKSGEKIKLPADIFEIAPNEDAIYQSVRTYLGNQRQGTTKVKTRGEVRGGGRKPFRQKHTGQARRGSSRSPLFAGGGAIFGPQVRDYSRTLPAGLHKLARKSALSLKARDGQIRIVEDFSFDVPKTRQMVTILAALDLRDAKTLLLMPKSDRNVVRSGQNVPTLTVLEADKASTYDFLNTSVLLIQRSAVEVLQNTFRN